MIEALIVVVIALACVLTIAGIIRGTQTLANLNALGDDPTELDYEAEADEELWRLRAAFGDDGDARHG